MKTKTKPAILKLAGETVEEVPVVRLTVSPWISNKMKFFAFVSMLLLVYVHGYNLNERYLQPYSAVHEQLTFTTFFEYFVANGLVRFRIPMLFIISGYLFALHDYTPYKKRLARRFKTLMVPYFLWSLAGLLLAVALWYLPWTSAAVDKANLQPAGDKNFGQYTISDWVTAFIWPTSFQLWFIRCLFFYNMLYPAIRYCVLKVSYIWFPIVTIAWLMMMGFIVIEAEGLLFFSLGVWLLKKEKQVDKIPAWLSLKWTIPFFLGICIFKTWWAFAGEQWLGQYPHGLTLLFMHKIVVALGLVVAWYGLDSLVRLAMGKQWFSNLTSYGFIIYALHVPLITYLIDPTLQWLNGIPYARLIHFLVFPFMIIWTCIGAGYVLKHSVPSFYQMLTGDRGIK